MKSEHDLVQSLLAHDKDAAVPADHEARIREGLGALLDVVPVPNASPPEAPPHAPSPSADAVNAVADAALRKWATLGLVAALAAGGGFVAGRATAPSVVTPAPVTMVTPPIAPVVPLPTASTAESIATAAPPSASVASAQPSSQASSQGATGAPAPSGDAFDREQSLLERARSALVRHDASAAEKALDEHDRQFPRSRHAEERDYLRIQVLRERGGDEARVRAQAKAFLAKYPESMLRSRVEPLAQ